ncbi:hypothetical protein LCGC14_1341240 [marine sediment metagenome]|uniref:Uncharacterized protein n=1 Tax=marine sediment metagenome TaxID=412755 RepID=A0A0F9MUM0_9ZZZZ
MGPGDEENQGSPYLYDRDGGGRRSNDVENPGQWNPGRPNPNQGIVDMPEAIEDPTDIDWMD